MQTKTEADVQLLLQRAPALLKKSSGVFLKQQGGKDMEGSLVLRAKVLLRRARGARPGASAAAVVAAVMDSDPGIVWDTGQASLLRIEELDRRSEVRIADHPYQTFFVGYGFRDLSDRIPLKDKDWVPLKNATIANLREGLRVLKAAAKARTTPKMKGISKIVEEMAPFTRSNHHITFERYCALLASGATPPPAPTASKEKRSAVAKARYSRLTQAQREKMQERRLLTRQENRAAKKADAAAAGQAERRQRDRDK